MKKTKVRKREEVREMGRKEAREMGRKEARPEKERLRNEVPPAYKAAMHKDHTPLQRVEKAEKLLEQTRTYFNSYLSSSGSSGRGICIWH